MFHYDRKESKIGEKPQLWPPKKQVKRPIYEFLLAEESRYYFILKFKQNQDYKLIISNSFRDFYKIPKNSAILSTKGIMGLSQQK